MAFGQQSGSPATAKQVQYLLSLCQKAGHSDFRDARGPLGLTQRQAAGKFSRDEASALIEQLLAEGGDEGDGSSPTPDPPPPPRSAPAKTPPRTIREIPAERLAAELERRGWRVTPPGEAPPPPPG